MHLTNYAINKKNKNFYEDWSDGGGSVDGGDNTETVSEAMSGGGGADSAGDEEESATDAEGEESEEESSESEDEGPGRSEDATHHAKSSRSSNTKASRLAARRQARAVSRVAKRNKAHAAKRLAALAAAKAKRDRMKGIVTPQSTHDPPSSSRKPEDMPAVFGELGSGKFQYEVPYDSPDLTEGHGSKWGFAALMNHLKSKGHDTNKMWDRVRAGDVWWAAGCAVSDTWVGGVQICGLCVKTFLAVLSHTRHMQKSCRVDQGTCMGSVSVPRGVVSHLWAWRDCVAQRMASSR